MPLFEKIFDKIFPKDQEVTVHEVLKRSPQFIADFENWKKSEEAHHLLGIIHESYMNKLAHKEPEIDIEIYHSPYANGFIIYPGSERTKISFESLMEYVKDILENEGYRLVHSDRRLKETGRNVKAIEKYYLKPPISSDVPIDQLFGNVIIELSYKNHEPSKFRVMVNIYSDRLYLSPRDFEELISLLFEKRSAS